MRIRDFYSMDGCVAAIQLGGGRSMSVYYVIVWHCLALAGKILTMLEKPGNDAPILIYSFGFVNLLHLLIGEAYIFPHIGP